MRHEEESPSSQSSKKGDFTQAPEPGLQHSQHLGEISPYRISHCTSTWNEPWLVSTSVRLILVLRENHTSRLYGAWQAIVLNMSWLYSSVVLTTPRKRDIPQLLGQLHECYFAAELSRSVVVSATSLPLFTTCFRSRRMPLKHRCLGEKSRAW